MLDLTLMERIGARPPPTKELVKAWKLFFGYKRRRKEAVNSVQVGHALRTFRFLRRFGVGEEEFGLDTGNLREALTSLKQIPKDEAIDFKEFAKELYAEIRRRSPQIDDLYWTTTTLLCSVLARTGDAAEVRKLAESNLSPGSEITLIQRNLWRTALYGFCLENNEAEVLKTMESIEALGINYSPALQEIMVEFYATRNRVDATKRWYSKPVTTTGKQKEIPKPETVYHILQFCFRNNQLDWCKNVFKDLLRADPNPPKRYWDIIFQWAAGALGKGVEDVERMMQVMADQNQGVHDHAKRPDIDTINGLVELANSKNDPYLAERYVALGLKSGIRPNAKTYILQLNYRLQAGDLTGADAAYESLQAEEILNNEDLPVINKYIQALCASRVPPYDRIRSITTDIEERNVRLHADTVSALCMVYLNREELDEVTDLLQSNCYHYTLNERARIRDGFIDFCLDRNNPTALVWDAYTIMRFLFDETDTPTRTKLMQEFFRRRRSDMACHVFGHMRQHIRQDKRPTLDTYIACFEGIARCADRESLDMVHNMFKMDSAVEPNTRLYNSLMMAYTACDDAYRSLEFWDDITNSREGPSYRSLEIVFQACQKKPFGDKLARVVWGKMRRMEIEVTREVHAAYCGALAGQGKLEEAEGMIEVMEKDLGFKPDVLTHVSPFPLFSRSRINKTNSIGTIYNAIHGQNRKDMIEEWAKELYPSVWEEIEKLGFEEQEEGHQLINMPEREIKA